MNDLPDLSTLGFIWPTPAYLIGSLVFGLVGWVAFRRGRRASRPELTWSGVALMAYPYLVSQTWLLWLIGAALSGYVVWCWE